jgi:hypothetical protein
MANLIDDLASMLVAESANAVTRHDRCVIRRYGAWPGLPASLMPKK